MVDFNGNILIIGCGSVTQCALPILLNKLKTSPKNITVLDFVDNRRKIEAALSAGVNYVQKQITKENYAEVLHSYLKKGDLCLDLAWNLDTVSLIDWCHN